MINLSQNIILVNLLLITVTNDIDYHVDSGAKYNQLYNNIIYLYSNNIINTIII